jgi:signal transduction histidine kinase
LSDEQEPLYRLWPRYQPGSVELGGAGLKLLLRTGLALLAVAMVLCFPPLVRATSLEPPVVLALFGGFFVCMVGNDYVLQPWALRSRAGFNAQLVITPGYNVTFFLLLVALPGDPKTPLWMGALLYACTTAAWQEIDTSWSLLALHTLAPLLTIPYFLHLAPDNGWSIGGPALCAVVSAVAYHLGAGVKVAWRRVRSEQRQALEVLRARNAELERQHIAQDLHDVVGSSLAIFGLSADLVERNAAEPDRLRSIAGDLREASREGLSELRGMLDSLAPETTSFGELGRALKRAARRMSAMSGSRVELTVAGDDDASIDGAVRLATMRIFQEAVNNALRHAAALVVEARLSVEQQVLSLSVVNDGARFAPGDAQTNPRGIVGMRERAVQLGGSFEISTLLDGRTDVNVVIPLTTLREPVPAPA